MYVIYIYIYIYIYIDVIAFPLCLMGQFAKPMKWWVLSAAVVMGAGSKKVFLGQRVYYGRGL